MNPLLEAFLSEARDGLQGIGEKLMQLENKPDDAELMIALFRLVHTLKGNSGLFDLPEMTRVLHAGEDLMDAVRQGRVAYSKELADRLLDAMDFVGTLCDEVEASGAIGANHAAASARLTQSLRSLMTSVEVAAADAAVIRPEPSDPEAESLGEGLPLADIPEAVRMDAYRRARGGGALHWIDYRPEEGCFFQGDDPFFQARGTPDVLWGGIVARQPWPALPELDAFRCVLDFQILSGASREALDEHYRYVPEQIHATTLSPLSLCLPAGLKDEPAREELVTEALDCLAAGDLDGLGRVVRTRLELSKPEQWLSSTLRWLTLVLEVEPENRSALRTIIESLRAFGPPQWSPARPTTLTNEEATCMRALVAVQRRILALPIEESWQLGRVSAASASLAGCLRASGDFDDEQGLATATAKALELRSAAPLQAWLDGRVPQAPGDAVEAVAVAVATAEQPVADTEVKFGRRVEDVVGSKILKVDQTKIDRLMNLIGEIVVSKNALPYLAARAETIFGQRELAREIKAQYTVINRIAQEMQDAIMQVRMMPVSFVFQRFPRLVRDISRKLGKEVDLVLEGEETEADKNIIEALGDPLVHIVRNSLDHGFELPDVRRAAGKPVAGTLTIRANQEADRVVIEIHDDGKGIDPTVVKRKAYQKGLIDEDALASLSDQEAVNLVFAPGFSTMEAVSDLSGRGVGMDVVRTAVEKVNGTVELESEKGKGTRIRLTLPLSMAVSNVMLIESDGQLFGVPMESVVETVRVPRAAIHMIKQHQATMLRGRVVPLKAINTLLGLEAPPKANGDDELAVLVVRSGDELVGLLVDGFRETVEIILKPLSGVLAGMPAYSGSALMGDGAVLMVLNTKELL